MSNNDKPPTYQLTRIGFLGFGEAAQNLSKGLSANPSVAIAAYDPQVADEGTASGAMREAASESGITLCSEPREILTGTTVIFSAVPAKFLIEAARPIVPNLAENQIFADLSASSSSLKQQLAREFPQQAQLLVDASVMGPVPLKLEKVPILASGPSAEKLAQTCKSLGMNIVAVSPELGKSSDVKLIRSIFMKSYAALCVELLTAAEASGTTDTVLKTLSDTFDGPSFEQTVERMTRGIAIHSDRRAHELSESISLQADLGLEPKMTQAARSIHEDISASAISKHIDPISPHTFKHIVRLITNIKEI